ncbi:AUGMIN subunit 3, variant 2 [Lathyrus oleraceus]|uniref:AUGMIN subunit 3, variant 2 n=1 Tax=Pisum sativum TaxID=3888 RepID=A0A9D4W0V5_PEA|nr:AUGMIN subunit 3, variant 2 [Pisum sativum]
MSGARLCSLLGELGYEGRNSGSDSLDPDSFEWPFQYEDTRPILHWICSTLRPSNILSLSELSQEETLAYKTEAADLQRQLRELQSQFDMLSGQASTLTQGRRARVGATSVVSGHLATIEESLSGRNLQMNAVLGRIASTAEELAHYHSGDEDGIYLAYSDFTQFLFEDSSCLKELNQWFSKQLDTTIPELCWELAQLQDTYILQDTQAALSTYVSAPGIVQQISALHSDLMTLQSDLDNSLPEERNRCINELSRKRGRFMMQIGLETKVKKRKSLKTLGHQQWWPLILPNLPPAR